MSNDEEHELLIEALALLRWVSTCVYMRGPVGTKAYFISDEVMNEIHNLKGVKSDVDL